MFTHLKCPVAVCAVILTAGAEVKPLDSWGFDIETGKSPEEQEFVSRQNPQRRMQELSFGFVPGVPGVSHEALWCGIGAEGRISSAMILPPRGNFTFSFYAGFPEPLKGRLEIAHNPKMSVFFTSDGKFAVSLLDTTVSGDVSVIPFEKAAAVFEQMEPLIAQGNVSADEENSQSESSYDIRVDRVELNLIRVRDSGDLTGLYAPAWVFYGKESHFIKDAERVTEGEVRHAPWIVMAVNAVDGSVIDIIAGY